MQCGSDEVWRWSGQFLEVLERWLREPPAAAAARRDWTKHKLRLALWQREVEKARALYLQDRAVYFQGRPGDLRSLYDRWRAITPDDAPEQVRLACERYQEFQRLLSD
jgi:hypothetical protein